MIYRFKRALGLALLLYVATFIVGIVCGVVSGQDMSTISETPAYAWYVGMVAAVVLTALFSVWYFRNRNIMASVKSGLLFGLTAIVLSSVLDFLLFTLGSPSGAEVNLDAYYGDFRFWITLALVLLTASLVGLKKRSQPLTV